MGRIESPLPPQPSSVSMEGRVGVGLCALLTHRERSRMAEEREREEKGGGEVGSEEVRQEEEEEGVPSGCSSFFHKHCEKHHASPCWKREGGFSSSRRLFQVGK